MTSSQEEVTRRPISTSPRRLKQVSNETPNNFSVVRQQYVSWVRIHDVSLVRLYDVSCKSQIKHPITSLWHISTTFSSYVCCDVLLLGIYYVFKLLCQHLHLERFHISFMYQVKYQIFLVPNKRETRRVVWIINK